MKLFPRGRESKLSALTPLSRLEVGKSEGSELFDVSCFGLDGENKLSDDRYLVFYDQKESSHGEMQACGPSGETTAEVFRVDLDELPTGIRKLALTLAVGLESEETMAGLFRGHLRLVADGEEVARHPLSVPVLDLKLWG